MNEFCHICGCSDNIKYIQVINGKDDKGTHFFSVPLCDKCIYTELLRNLDNMSDHNRYLWSIDIMSRSF